MVETVIEVTGTTPEELSEAIQRAAKDAYAPEYDIAVLTCNGLRIAAIVPISWIDGD